MIDIIAGFLLIPRKPFSPKSWTLIVNSVGIPALDHALSTAFSTVEARMSNDRIN
jgi:hypothetical protein